MTASAKLLSKCQIRYYEREAPGLLAAERQLSVQVMWYTTEGDNYSYPDEPLRHTLEHLGRDVRVKLGGWLLDCIYVLAGLRSVWSSI